jgi:hypothetical protein
MLTSWRAAWVTLAFGGGLFFGGACVGTVETQGDHGPDASDTRQLQDAGAPPDSGSPHDAEAVPDSGSTSPDGGALDVPPLTLPAISPAYPLNWRAAHVFAEFWGLPGRG